MKKLMLIHTVVLLLIFSLSTFPQQPVTKLRTVKQIQKPKLSAVNHWPDWCAKAVKSTIDAIGFWCIQAKIVNGRINGPSAIAPAGCLSSPSLMKNIKAFMVARQVPKQIAAGFASGISTQWEKWQSKVTIPGLPLYPGFAAWSGPTAPPTPGIPMPLSAFVSTGLSQMSEPKIYKAVKTALGNAAGSPLARPSLEKFSRDLSLRFLVWISKVKVVNLVGQGPVPSFAPPFRPSGPVIGGTILPNPGILSCVSF